MLFILPGPNRKLGCAFAGLNIERFLCLNLSYLGKEIHDQVVLDSITEPIYAFPALQRFDSFNPRIAHRVPPWSRFDYHPSLWWSFMR